MKRKRVKGGDAHHGGAWKVAYADFVTAMMAFFLLMWLLNATTEKQRKGLADYFSPTISFSQLSNGGDGTFWGESVFSEDTLVQNGQGASMLHPSQLQQARGDVGVKQGRGDQARGDVEKLLETLMARGGEAMSTLLQQRHVISRLSDEGLVIDIFSQPDGLLFDPETAKPTPLLSSTLGTVAEVLELVSNEVAVNAYLPSEPVVRVGRDAWKLSGDRADVARRVMERRGLPSDRLARISGFADRKPIDRDPMALRNERVEIVVLRSAI
ncbi:flagellar motor protein MotB [Qingshengfaniella alkalisoli]|uniref:flagellar motor protein MotB n=1 Tax=Qingshengfaniella alkalisoli TaxID=2599296 RepID=UPI00308446BC